MNRQLNERAFTGDVPLSRFGHSITFYTEENDKLCLYGGAAGTSNKFEMVDSAYSLDMKKYEWKKIECTGIVPSGRAAHGAACFQKNKIVMYGGATQQGLASDQLYVLDIKEGVGIWNIACIKHKTPGKRYGHTLIYSQPFLIVFGGNAENKAMNDLWVLNIQKKPLSWCQVKCQGEIPRPRDYHTASLCTSGSASGMTIIFGGRSENKEALNDCWGLVRHISTGLWEWIKAPIKTKPIGRYQHHSIFMQNLMIITGGKSINLTEQMPLDVFDITTNNWVSFEKVTRFRHVSWYFNKKLFLLGGLNLSGKENGVDPQQYDLQKLFYSNLELLGTINKKKLQKSPEKASSQTSTKLKSQSPDNSRATIQALSPIIKKQKIKFQFERQQKIIEQRKLVPLTNKKRPTILAPVYGKQQRKLFDKSLTRGLRPKQEVAHYFLNKLMHPNKLAHFQNFTVKFEAMKIIQLCDLAEQIIANQPMLLNVKAPAKIFGDIHGQLSDLMQFFELYGSPHEKGVMKDIQNFDYIFLGDYVDRGNHSLQVICLLLALKVLYPNQMHLLRGNHQDARVNCDFGFLSECQRKMQEQAEQPSSVYNRINQLFEWFPLGAIAEEKILCIHGGIGKGLNYVEEINQIKRPLQIMHEVIDHESQLVLDILWSDPTESDAQLGIHPNYPRDPRQLGDIVRFGPDRVQSFLKNNNLSMILRAHQCVQDGFERFANGSLITVFSATDYCRRHKNAGAILLLKTNLQIVPKIIYPKKSNANTWLDEEQTPNRRPPTPPRWRTFN